jgi:AraC-like DNA-binding protein
MVISIFDPFKIDSFHKTGHTRKFSLSMPLNKWTDYLKKNLFKKYDGFFELPYLSNSPELMVESMISLPISNHNTLKQAIFTDNPFTTGEMRYRKIEDGLWLLGSDIRVKQNIISKAFYDENQISGYYFLSFAVFEYKFPINSSRRESATLLSTTCTFYKPKTEVSTYFYEGTKGRFFNLVFNRKWAEKNIGTGTAGEKKQLLEYLDDQPGFINWLNIVPDAPQLSVELWDMLNLEKTEGLNTPCLKIKIEQIISDFFRHAFLDERIKKHTALHNPDYANVAAAEKLILHNLNTAFIGVEKIARAVNLSPTKLKIVFKSVFGFSMLQYHKEKNMLLAQQLIRHSDIQIKNIAAVTGYTSSSKFTAAFKKRFGILPTDTWK